MDTYNEYILKYHNGGSLLREGEVKYVNGNVSKFVVGPNKFCYWDLLGDLKELGYSIKKTVNFFL